MQPYYITCGILYRTVIGQHVKSSSLNPMINRSLISRINFRLKYPYISIPKKRTAPPYIIFARTNRRKIRIEFEQKKVHKI